MEGHASQVLTDWTAMTKKNVPLTAAIALWAALILRWTKARTALAAIVPVVFASPLDALIILTARVDVAIVFSAFVKVQDVENVL